MSRILYILVFICLAATTAFARNSQRSILEITLSDGSPLVVSINGRNYDKHGRSIKIGDLPKGRHDLRVYEYLEYRKGGGRAKLLYTGRIKVAAGTINYCEVDIRNGDMRVKTMDLSAPVVHATASGEVIPAGKKVWQPGGKLTDQEMDDLQLQAAEKETDIGKLELVKKALDKKTFTTKQVRNMAGWFAFEDSKLDFTKWAYSKTTDKGDYGKLDDIFTMDENKKEFKKITGDSK